MAKVLENRKSTFSLSTKKEIELTHIVGLAYNHLYKCSFACYLNKDEAYYRKGGDLVCEDGCYSDFIKVQMQLKGASEIQPMVDERESCMTECFKAVKGNTESIYCIERCNESFNNRLKKILAGVTQTMEAII
ncbi:hypothetical protein FGO68_gene4005 [Halteria grandinella]|uniref:Uncharacterized protein n=1 Tax=Halteria grandinella TaxID=5974 RepID=A0A8J8P2J7_HALGN|nr:hypothetical protein FGO68_gene4005 [Halteria grandinella]